MTGLLLALVFAAAPEATPRSRQVAVLVVRRTSVTPEEARAFADAAVAALREARVAVEEPSESLRRLSVLGVRDPTVCSGRKACVLELAKQLEVGAIVALSAAALQNERSIVFEATRVDGAVPLAKDAAVIKAGSPVLPEHLRAIVSALAGAFPAAATPAPTPEPVVTIAPPAKVDEPVKQEITEAPAAAPSRSHAPAWVAGGLGAAAAVTSAGLGITALSARSRLLATSSLNGQSVSMLPASEASALASQANVFGAIAAAAALATLVLITVAVLLW